jgi:trk system potassium uptake protein TrkH
MTKEFNYKLVLRVMGSLALVESALLLATCLIPLIYGENDAHYFLIASLISLAFSGTALLIGKNPPTNIGKREGSVIVTFTWIIFTVIGLLPFWMSGSIPSFTDAFFETISGFTTTGASILNNIEELSHGMLFWRSLTHWVGGLGIIVISLAILPVFSTSGTQLFGSETTGPTKDKIHPKINETAKRLFLIYIILTVSETILLLFGGMSLFDAVNHSFATVATGGFSTKQASVGYWDSAYIQYIISIFMILSGINFSLYYFGFKNKFEKIRENEELRYYIIVLFFFITIVALSLIDFSKPFSFWGIENAWRDSMFTVSSLMTTTGFVTADYMYWQPLTWVILIIVMLTGASAGSTSGGIKILTKQIQANLDYLKRS